MERRLLVLLLLGFAFVSTTNAGFTNKRVMTYNTELRTVAPMAMDKYSKPEPAFIGNLTESVGFVGFTARLMSSKNKTISQAQLYLHHCLITSVTLNDTACPENPAGFVAGTGNEYTKASIPYPFAMNIPVGSKWHVAIDVMNPSMNQTVEYYLQYNVTLVDWTDDIIPAQGYFNSITGCAGDDSLEFDVPQDNTTDVYYSYLDFPMSLSGMFVWLGGHLHSGGKSLHLLDLDSGEVFYNGFAHYDPNHPSVITSIDSSNFAQYVTMNTNFRLGSAYDCSEAHPDAMAIVYGYAVTTEVYSGVPPLKQTTGVGNPLVDNQSSWSVSINFENVGQHNGDTVFTILLAVGVVLVVGLTLLLLSAVLAVLRLRKIHMEYTATAD